MFDEHVSPRVARSLRELSLNVEYVGGNDQPPKGSEDGEVLMSARTKNQTIVTTNHDMIVLCMEENESVVWLDPRDKDISLRAIAEMCFRHIDEWERQLAGQSGPVCVVARKTRTDVMDPERATRIAMERGKRRRRKKTLKPSEPLGGLLSSDDA